MPTCSGAGMAPEKTLTAASLGEVSACTNTRSRPDAFMPLSSATCTARLHHALVFYLQIHKSNLHSALRLLQFQE